MGVTGDRGSERGKGVAVREQGRWEGGEGAAVRGGRRGGRYGGRLPENQFIVYIRMNNSYVAVVSTFCKSCWKRKEITHDFP